MLMKIFRSKPWLIGNMIFWWPICFIAQFGPDPNPGQPTPPTDKAIALIMCGAIGFWAWSAYRKNHGKLPKVPGA